MVTLLDGHSQSNANGFVRIQAIHPSSTTYRSAIGQAFKVKTTGAKYKLTQIKVYLGQYQSPTGHLKAVLYNITGTYGTNAKPTGSPLAESELVDVSVLGSDFSVIVFNFVGANQYEVLKDHVYGFAIQAVDGNIDSDRWVKGRWRGETGGCETHDGNWFGFKNSTWEDNNDFDLCFLVYGELVPPPPPQDHKITMQTPVGEGTVVPSVGVHWYADGTKVNVTATPTEGHEFQYWDISQDGMWPYKTSKNPKQLTMTTDYTVKATFAELPPVAGEWVSPTGFEDPDNKWAEETKAYDDDIGTFAQVYVPLLDWCSFLYLTIDEIICDRVRVYIDNFEDSFLVDIDVLLDDVWTHVYQGSYPYKEWMTKTFSVGKVSKMRVRLYGTTTGSYREFYEADFWSIPPVPPPLLGVKVGRDLAVLLTGTDKGKVVILV